MVCWLWLDSGKGCDANAKLSSLHSSRHAGKCWNTGHEVKPALMLECWAKSNQSNRKTICSASHTNISIDFSSLPLFRDRTRTATNRYLRFQSVVALLRRSMTRRNGTPFSSYSYWHHTSPSCCPVCSWSYFLTVNHTLHPLMGPRAKCHFFNLAPSLLAEMSY